jgi:hypothetical protein
MGDTRKTSAATIRTNSIFQNEVSAFHLDAYAKTEESNDALSRRDRDEIAVPRLMGYV